MRRVPVQHKGAVNAVLNSASKIPIEAGQRVMQFMPIGFDVCQWEIWKTLSSGATLVLRGTDPYGTVKTVDMSMFTITALTQLGHPSNYPKLKCIATGGESMPTSLKDLWSPYVRLVNCYGPSECSITTHYEIMSVESPVMIGRPIDNVLSYVLDENQRLVPIGVVGELYLGGVCVSQGYINLPEQTEQRFLPDPFAGESTTMFRTGDSARSLPDGKLQITGRLDTQVKVKGVNGKTDRKALGDMDVVIEVEDLSSSNENLLARVWEDILEIKYKGIRPTTSFYSHGGDNISAYQLVAKEKQVSRNLNSANAMKFPTLSEMEAISKIYNQERDLEETTVTESGAQNKEETESFWRTYLAGTTSYALTLGKADTEECTSSLSLIASVSMNKLTALAKEYSSTVAVMAKLAWAATLRKYTRSNDVVFGQVMTNRDIPVLGS
ncbi:unnamed protein product [Aphanomyces euteiches]